MLSVEQHCEGYQHFRSNKLLIMSGSYPESYAWIMSYHPENPALWCLEGPTL